MLTSTKYKLSQTGIIIELNNFEKLIVICFKFCVKSNMEKSFKCWRQQNILYVIIKVWLSVLFIKWLSIILYIQSDVT